MSSAEQIKNGKAVIGIEFGSTRIKAVLIGEDHVPLAAGIHDWQNELLDGVWTYSLQNVKIGLFVHEHLYMYICIYLNDKNAK